MPDVDFIEFNNLSDIEKITHQTAGVVLETIQGGAGFIELKNEFKKISERCKQTETLLVLDEIQPGFGRTVLFGFEHYNCVQTFYGQRIGRWNANWSLRFK